MKSQLFLLGSLLFLWSMPVQAQSNPFHVFVGCGGWRPSANTDPNVSLEPLYQFSANLGMGVGVPLTKWIGAKLDLALEVAPMHSFFTSSKVAQEVLAHVTLYSTQVSVGVDIRPTPDKRFHFAPSYLLSFATGATGQYVVRYWRYPVDRDSVYAGDWSHIRHTLIGGPEVKIGYDFPLPNGASLTPRGTIWISTDPIWRYTLDTPHNPEPFRLQLELAYSFPSRKRSNK